MIDEVEPDDSDEPLVATPATEGDEVEFPSFAEPDYTFEDPCAHELAQLTAATTRIAQLEAELATIDVTYQVATLEQLRSAIRSARAIEIQARAEYERCIKAT